MDTRREIREFLTSRRARITPQQVGLPTYGSRRLPGLRREEVAVLAGVSVAYYTRSERGDLAGASGKALAGGRRDNVLLATKFHNAMGDDPNHQGDSRRSIVRAVEDSLRRLGTDWIDEVAFVVEAR